MNDLDEKYTKSDLNLTEAVLATCAEGQQKILNSMLKSGVPLNYRDEQGNLVQKNPNGTIEIIQKA